MIFIEGRFDNCNLYQGGGVSWSSEFVQFRALGLPKQADVELGRKVSLDSSIRDGEPESRWVGCLLVGTERLNSPGHPSIDSMPRFNLMPPYELSVTNRGETEWLGCQITLNGGPREGDGYRRRIGHVRPFRVLDLPARTLVDRRGRPLDPTQTIVRTFRIDCDTPKGSGRQMATFERYSTDLVAS